MNWLAVLIANIATLIIERLGGDLFGYLKQKKATEEQQKEVDAQSKASVAPLQAAKTSQEIDAATKAAFDQT